ncbi:MAG TPA: DUF4180 domain-containing protein [Roseiflexaceae bacterium]|nr:DUF4180 domain-containing protein [Roseiflexaceae bacterium]
MTAVPYTLGIVEGVSFVEGQPDAGWLREPGDVNRLIEACLGEGARAAILYSANLTPAFFDLSSGEAGAILQKLRNYRICLAIVCPPGSVRWSILFHQLLLDERRGNQFDVLDTRDAALAWVARTAAS